MPKRWNARWAVALLTVMQVSCVAATCHAGDRWSRPIPAAPVAQLPKLAQPINVDGDLSEWSGAVSVPVRHKSDICFLAHGHQWRGPADVSMEAYCAWRAEGLCLAAVVADDKVENLRTDAAIWLEDSVEMYVDGRRAEKQATSPYTPGAYQLLITPPLPGRETRVKINDRDGDIAGLQVAGKSTVTGYVIETLIPWGAFPEFTPKPGAQIAFNFAVNDYDGDDPNAERPIQLNRGGAKLLWEHPEGCIKWELVPSIRTGETVPLGPLAALDVPDVSGNGVPLRLSAEVGRLLSDDVRSVRFKAADADGRPLFDRTVKISPVSAPWAGSVHAELEWRADSPPADGFAGVMATLFGRDGRPLGFVDRHVLFVNRTQQDTLARLRSADVAKLSQTHPFKAAGYLGVGSCYERLKRAVAIQDLRVAAQSARELAARLDLLERRNVGAGAAGLVDLLNLAAEPEAQVVIEYPMFSESSDGPEVAYVTFYWGPVRLIGARVYQYSSSEEAAEKLGPNRRWLLLDLPEKTSVDGLPAAVSVPYGRRIFDLNEFAPERQLALFVKQSELLRIIGLDLLSRAQVDAVTVLADCPAPVRDHVTAWAEEAGRPILDLEEAVGRDKALIAGDVRKVADRLGKQWAFVYALRDGPVDLRVLDGDRVVSATGPSKAICQRAARLILAGEPVAASQIDSLRREMVRQLAPRTRPPPIPAGFNLYCGDVHMHSFYSDGTPSPVGLWLQALYNYMDFAVMTDHDTIEGALVGQKLLGEHGFSFPFIVGEEMSADWSDFGAYPLKAPISSSLSAHDMFKAAHVQGAVIQWNHPGGPISDWAAIHLKDGISHTSLDAWEHLPDTYDEWRKAGTLPVIVGSTDTHNGAFGEYPERTIILAPTPQGDDLAEAIRSRHAIALIPDTDLLYGSDRMVSVAWQALAQGEALKAGTAERLKETLRNADLAGLLKASPPRPVALRELGTSQ